MIQVGKINGLVVSRSSPHGLYLDGGDRGEILLPTRYVPPSAGVGDRIEVFLYHDSEDRLIATTEKPRAMVGEFVFLNVVALERVGAFLDWGLSKDLLLPFSEQTRPLRVGEEAAVYLYLDRAGRVSASMKLGKHRVRADARFNEGQEVELRIVEKTDLGFNALIGKSHVGLLYDNEIFRPLRIGERLMGYVKRLRQDGKIDLVLQKKAAPSCDTLLDRIVAALEEKGGFLPINDKTPPEVIYRTFGVSKKRFKAALGSLYRRSSITIGDDGIRRKGGAAGRGSKRGPIRGRGRPA